MPEDLDRSHLIEVLARALQAKYSREGLAEFLRGRLGIDVDPQQIKHKGAFLEARLLDLPTDDLLSLADDLGVDVSAGSQVAKNSTGTSKPSDRKEEAPQTWIGLAFWAASKPRRVVAALIVALCVGAILVGVGRFLGYDIFASLFPRLARVKTHQLQDAGLQFCIDEAQRRGKAYVILAATEVVEIRDWPPPPDKATKRQAIVRNTYTLLMLKDVAKESSTEFFEAYTSDNRATIDRWHGSERETPDASGSTYDVLFDAKAGETHTVVTGSTYNIPLPLPPNRSAFGQNTSLAENEDTWGYPNVIDGDVIREITIVLWSPTTRLIPVGQAAKRLTNRTVKGSDVFVNNSPRLTDPATQSISAHWHNLLPGEEVGIQFSW